MRSLLLVILTSVLLLSAAIPASACLRCCNGSIHSSELPPISAFAFNPTCTQPAFAFEETKIGFRLRESHDNYENYDSIDLGELLDSPTVDLEWGQPIFYEGR